jgi:integrase
MAWQRQYPERRLILGVGTGYDTPSTGLLGRLKTLAKRDKVMVKDATLHKFRRTFITTLLRSGKMSLREVQAQAGHSSLAATDRYLKALEAEKLVDPFDSIFG